MKVRLELEIDNPFSDADVLLAVQNVREAALARADMAVANAAGTIARTMDAGMYNYSYRQRRAR